MVRAMNPIALKPGCVDICPACPHRSLPKNESLLQKQQWLESRNEVRKILAYANPPRTGLEAAVREWLAAELQPEKIAYLSCSAGTLYRDLVFLTNHGFEIKRIIPYDFFPQTLHVETLALIEYGRTESEVQDPKPK